jgi:hypothetical protein
MKVSANVIAVVAWVSFLATFVYPLFAGGIPHIGYWLTAVLMSFVVGLIIPSYLLRLDITVAKGPAATRPESKRGQGAS